MTVCIAAICAGGYIIGAADRMLTAGDIQFQPETAKIIVITSSIAIMIAGDASLQAEILQKVIADVNSRIVAEPDNWWEVADVAELYYKYYNQARFKQAEGAILAPLGLTADTFFDKQKVMDSELVRQIATELINHEIPDVEAICCGVGPSDTHVYIVGKEGISCQDLVGFASIGIGKGHANSQFMFARHNRFSPATETLLLVYSAKKRAEVAPGVGEATDMIVLGPLLGQMNVVDESTLENLDVIYNEEQEEVKEANQQSIAKVNQYVEEFSKTAVAERQATERENGGGDPPADQKDFRDGIEESE